MENYNAFYLLVIILGFSSCIGPVLTFLREKKKEAYTYLVILSLITGPVWSISTISFLATESYSLGNFLIKVIYLSSVVIGVFHFAFSSNYLQKRKVSILTYIILYAGALIISYSILYTNNFISSIEIGNNNYAHIGCFYYIWILWLIYIFSGNLFHILKQYNSLSFIEKEQQKYLIIGAVLTTIGSFPANIFLPIWGIYKYIWFGPVVFSLSNIIISYGLTQTKFMRFSKLIRQLIRNFSLYLVPSLILVFSPSYTIKNFSNSLSINSSVLNILLVLLVSIFLRFLETLSQKLFLSEKDLLERSVKAFSFGIGNNANLEEMANNALRYISDKTPIKISKLLIYDDANRKSYVFGEGKWNFKNIEKILIEIPRYWNSHDEKIKPLVRAELEYTRNKDPLGSRQLIGILQILEIEEIQIVYPVISDIKIVGLFLVKDLPKNEIFKSSELILLDSIYYHFHNYINKALLYQQLQTFNKTLQQKVDLQTKELQIKVEQLQEARKKESDMIDIMGHELRTPATIVKLNADFLTKFIGEIQSDPLGYQKYVKRIQDSIDSEIKLINTLLSSAKLEGDKIELNPEEVDIKKEIEMSLDGNFRESNDKGIELINQTDINTPRVYADRARVVEILNNLVSNGIKYTEKGSVTINTEYDEEIVKVSIEDTGNGISKEDISQLGQKFYRVSNYIESSKDDNVSIVRPGGTGLGLYVTFNLVKKMGGNIWVESELGKGSKFIFTLPRYKGQEDTREKTDSKDMFERLGLK